jgi:hypothetical protein
MTDATPTHRRWYQFGLRTLFLAVAVVAARSQAFKRLPAHGAARVNRLSLCRRG